MHYIVNWKVYGFVKVDQDITSKITMWRLKKYLKVKQNIRDCVLQLRESKEWFIEVLGLKLSFYSFCTFFSLSQAVIATFPIKVSLSTFFFLLKHPDNFGIWHAAYEFFTLQFS